LGNELEGLDVGARVVGLEVGVSVPVQDPLRVQACPQC
jgi:hypothetical protein